MFRPGYDGESKCSLRDLTPFSGVNRHRCGIHARLASDSQPRDLLKQGARASPALSSLTEMRWERARPAEPAADRGAGTSPSPSAPVAGMIAVRPPPAAPISRIVPAIISGTPPGSPTGIPSRSVRARSSIDAADRTVIHAAVCLVHRRGATAERQEACQEYCEKHLVPHHPLPLAMAALNTYRIAPLMLLSKCSRNQWATEPLDTPTAEHRHDRAE